MHLLQYFIKSKQAAAWHLQLKVLLHGECCVYRRLEFCPRNPSVENKKQKKQYAKKVSLFSDECRADLNKKKKSQSENELGVLTAKGKITTYLEK